MYLYIVKLEVFSCQALRNLQSAVRKGSSQHFLIEAVITLMAVSNYTHIYVWCAVGSIAMYKVPDFPLVLFRKDSDFVLLF